MRHGQFQLSITRSSTVFGDDIAVFRQIGFLQCSIVIEYREQFLPVHRHSTRNETPDAHKSRPQCQKIFEEIPVSPVCCCYSFRCCHSVRRRTGRNLAFRFSDLRSTKSPTPAGCTCFSPGIRNENRARVATGSIRSRSWPSTSTNWKPDEPLAIGTSSGNRLLTNPKPLAQSRLDRISRAGHGAIQSVRTARRRRSWQWASGYSPRGHHG